MFPSDREGAGNAVGLSLKSPRFLSNRWGPPYYLSSMPLDAKLFAYAVRCHWHVENRLHWVLDVVFHENLSRLRSGDGPQNMATVWHMAMNLNRGPKDKHSLKVSQ